MIKVQNLNFGYKQFTILNNINLDIKSGEFIAVIGPNGAGKSTLLSCLANEYSEVENQILFKNNYLKNWTYSDLSLHKAKFSQHQSNEINLTVLEVIIMGRYGYFNSLPNNTDMEFVKLWMQNLEIDHLQNRNYNQLSGGEKQRVHLARIMVQLENSISNKVVLLDEPLNNLDISHQHKILNILNKYKKNGHTVIAVLHDINLAGQFADKIILMKNGNVIGYNKPEVILTQQIISDTYNFPCIVCKNPLTQQPLILFGT